MNTNDIWLIAGLGNPETKYDGTRHNAGYAALDYLADKWGISVSKTKFEGLWGQGEVDGHKVVLLKPLTYMNLSGDSIAPLAGFFKIPADSSTMLMFIVYCILFYLGFSLCANQYPLMEDAIGLWHALYGKDGANLFVKIVLFIPTVLIIAGAFLERYALNILLMAGTVAFAALTA